MKEIYNIFSIFTKIIISILGGGIFVKGVYLLFSDHNIYGIGYMVHGLLILGAGLCILYFMDIAVNRLSNISYHISELSSNASLISTLDNNESEFVKTSIVCPKCGNNMEYFPITGYLYHDINNNYYKCFRCGSKFKSKK